VVAEREGSTPLYQGLVLNMILSHF